MPAFSLRTAGPDRIIMEPNDHGADRDARPATRKPEPIPTKRGDVLILCTRWTFSTCAVGLVVADGQQDFTSQPNVHHLKGQDDAIAAASRLLGPGGRVFILDIDTRTWSVVKTPPPLFRPGSASSPGAGRKK
jgi:hypothetical protein